MRTKEECTPKRRPNAANRGQPLQDALDDLHAAYLSRGLAFVLRTSAPMKITKRLAGGKFQAVFVAEGMPDYFAVSAGRAFVFDAKSHAGTSLPFSAIPEHQARAFDSAVSGEAEAAILVQLPETLSAWWAPWEDLGPLWWAWHRRTARAAPGTASISAAELDALAIPLVGLDWLGAVNRRDAREAA
jgi:penicillin-binding protein-related factor A (putative recombinase)